MTDEPLDLTAYEECWSAAARLTHSVRRAAMTVGDVGKLQRAAECIPELLAEVKRLRAQIAAVRALHTDRTPADIQAEHTQDGETWTPECSECSCYGDCRVELPCPTLQLLTQPEETP